MLHSVCLVGALSHCIFLLVFAVIGLPWLVWTNVMSVALSLGGRALLARRRNMWAVSLITGEVVLHAVVASALLGWDSGFHYYLLTLVGPLSVGMSGSAVSKFARLATFGLGYAWLDHWARQHEPVYALAAPSLAVLRYLNIAGMLAIMAFVSLAYYRLVTAAESALRKLATTDPLTGLYNRRHLFDITRELRDAARQPHALCVLICDIDHFKHVNDRHGHEIGDLVLQQVARALQSAVRPTDAVARWGGEEFVVLLSHADAATALEVGERIRRAVAALSIDRNEPAIDRPAWPRCAEQLQVTITVGVSVFDASESMDAAIARADAALFRGKASGRNKVVAGDEPIGPAAHAA